MYYKRLVGATNCCNLYILNVELNTGTRVVADLRRLVLIKLRVFLLTAAIGVYEWYRYPHFLDWWYRTPTFQDEKVKNLQ